MRLDAGPYFMSDSPRRLALLAGLLCFTVGCDHQPEPEVDGAVARDAGLGSGDLDLPCPDKMLQVGRACVPVFSSCGSQELALAGGGCRGVGVEQKKGDLLLLPEGKVVTIGPTCMAGFSMGNNGGCEPVLPKVACPAGTMRVLGQTACQVVGNCGTGTWGKIPHTGDTLYVDGSHKGSDQDGTRTRPFSTIGAAVTAQKASASHRVIAVAAGTYNEDVVLTSAITFRGRCAKLVTIKGATAGVSQAMMLVGTSRIAMSVRDVTVTGPAHGIMVVSLVDVEIKNVVIRETGLIGLYVIGTKSGQPKVSFASSLITQCSGHGIMLSDATFSAQRSELRRGSQGGHHTLYAVSAYGQNKLQVTDSVIHQGSGPGLVISCASTEISRSVISDHAGIGLKIEPCWIGKKVKAKSTLVLRDSVVSRNRSHGLSVLSSTAQVENCTILDTRAKSSDNTSGMGLKVQDGTGSLKRCLVSGNRTAGVHFQGSQGLVERSVIRDTLVQPSDQRFGYGVSMSPSAATNSTVTVAETLISGNRTIGINAANSSVIVDRSLVRDTRPGVKGNTLGVGIAVTTDPSLSKAGAPVAVLTMRHTTVSGNSWSGIYLWGANASIEHSLVHENRSASINDVQFGGIVALVDPQGANRPLVKVQNTVMTNNGKSGITGLGVNLVVKRSAVRKSRAVISAGLDSAVGLLLIGSGPSWGNGAPTNLVLEDSVLEHIEEVGLAVIGGVRVAVDRVTIRDTKTRKAGDRGWGVWARTRPDGTGPRPLLYLRKSLIQRSHVAGVQLQDTQAVVDRCVVEHTDLPQGDGIVVEQVKQKSELTLTRSFIRNSTRAGVIFYAGGGLVDSTTFRSGTYAIVLEQGANPMISEHNRFLDNKRNGISFGRGLKPAKLPNIPTLKPPSTPPI